MRIFRGAGVALHILFSHRLRTALATTGIVVGVSSVVVMVAIGEGAQQQVLAKIQAMGTDLVLVSAGQVKLVAGRPRQTGNVTSLRLRDLKAIGEEASFVRAAAPSQSKKMLVRFDAASAMTTVTGTSEAIVPIRAYAMVRGRFFDDEENKGLARVAVIGGTVARNLFGVANPIGEHIRINKVSFQVVGLLADKGTDLAGADQDDVVYVPVNTALRRLFNIAWINNILVQAEDTGHIAAAAAEVTAILRERHRLRDRPDDFTVQSQTEMLAAEREVSQTFTGLLGAVAGISLLVGGVGILAIMLVSIKERTREIGLRRAVGALRRDLLLQFLVESLSLSVFGGTVGILMGVLIAAGLAWFSSWPLRLSLAAMGMAFLFSAIIGVVFGVYPAARAAALDPIEALRTE